MRIHTDNSLQCWSWSVTHEGEVIINHFTNITLFRLFIIQFFSEGKYVSEWFVGLDFNKMEGMNIDLTSDIQSFVEDGKVHMLLLPHHCN